MSENLDLVRSIYAAWERGDFSSVKWARSDLELVLTGGAPGDGRWTGLAAASEGWRDFLGQWEDLRIDADEYRELDGERILVLDHPRGYGKTSGIEVGQEGATLFHVHNGKVARVVSYWARALALTDLGLEE